MRWKRTLVGALAAAAVVGTPALADELELTGTLRDFQEAHPDMQYPDKSFGLRTGFVMTDLGEDGKPVLNTEWNNGDLAHAMIASESSFNQWYRNVDGVNLATKHTIVLSDPEGDGVYRYEASKHNGQSFFPLDGELFGNEGHSHNYHFTYEIHTKFTYTDPDGRDPMVFRFSGDDDVFVFVNKKLIVDLGGVHGETHAVVNIDDIAQAIGLEPGQTYDFDFFFAERHLTQSNFTIETSIQFLSPLYD